MNRPDVACMLPQSMLTPPLPNESAQFLLCNDHTCHPHVRDPYATFLFYDTWSIRNSVAGRKLHAPVAYQKHL